MRSLLAFALTGVALAVSAAVNANPVAEVELNNSLTGNNGAPQTVPQGSQIAAYLGNAPYGGGFADLDFYTFQGKPDQVVKITMKDPSGVLIWSLWDPSGLPRILNSTTADQPIKLDGEGQWRVGVTNTARPFYANGTAKIGRAPGVSYELDLVPVETKKIVSIIVKPGGNWQDGKSATYLNPASHAEVPVAIISTPDFNALSVDRTSLNFGSPDAVKAGAVKDSLAHCDVVGRDVNHDGRPDLVCFFHNEMAQWTGDEQNGTLTGKYTDANGQVGDIEGTGALYVKPKEAAE